MIFFIVFLRALAACLITNAHYTGIYPTDLIANGGLLGDILFFAVSGYCLYNIRKDFFRWYFKRIWRIYLPIIIITSVYLISGAYKLDAHSAFWWYIFPTNYLFLAAIVILYIPYYWIMKSDFAKKHLSFVMLLVLAFWLGIYIFQYDKSYYHIDAVWEPMILFLYMESMLLGAWFRKNDVKYRNAFLKKDLILLPAFFCGYFASKIIFSKNDSIAPLQFINQILIFGLLFVIFRLCAGLDNNLEHMPEWIRNIITFIADRTLEIYVVQFVIIDIIRPIGYFPVNWILLTASILAAACILHWVCSKIYALTDNLMGKRKTY